MERIITCGGICSPLLFFQAGGVLLCSHLQSEFGNAEVLRSLELGLIQRRRETESLEVRLFSPGMYFPFPPKDKSEIGENSCSVAHLSCLCLELYCSCLFESLGELRFSGTNVNQKSVLVIAQEVLVFPSRRGTKAAPCHFDSQFQQGNKCSHAEYSEQFPRVQCKKKKVVICSWVLHKLENELNFRNTLFYVNSLRNKNKTFISVVEVEK